MPSIGEQGWEELVSNNFEIIDTAIYNNLNNLQDQIDVINTNIDTIDTNIGDGTRILMIPATNQTITITSSNYGSYASYDENNVYIASFSENTTFESIPKPPHSCRLMIISVNGNATFSVNIDTYPTSLQSEKPPNSETTNTYANNISFVEYYAYKITLTYTANENNSILNMNQEDYLDFINNTMLYATPIFDTIQYSLSIPHAIASGGYGDQNGTAGTAENTCNGGGGGGIETTGGTGCIFGQYAGGGMYSNGYGYGSRATNKYRSALIFVVNGNLTINESCTITQIGGNGSRHGTTPGGPGGYGGGASRGGGGGAPVFIYYTGSYVNNGTINTTGGFGSGYGDGGAGGIKVTKISLQ